MLRKTTTQAIITQDQFIEFTLPMIGLSVSLVWHGYGSTIFLEIGDLTEKIIRGKNDKPRVSRQGQFGVMLEWSWRVERPKSICFGSESTNKIIDNRLAKLKRRTIKAIEVEGRLPELVIQLSDGFWVHSFSTSEGQPQWCLFLDRRQLPHEWLKSERGKLIKETDHT